MYVHSCSTSTKRNLNLEDQFDNMLILRSLLTSRWCFFHVRIGVIEKITNGVFYRWVSFWQRTWTYGNRGTFISHVVQAVCFSDNGRFLISCIGWFNLLYSVWLGYVVILAEYFGAHKHVNFVILIADHFISDCWGSGLMCWCFSQSKATVQYRVLSQ